MSRNPIDNSLPARRDGSILIIRLKSIGDILFTLPAVHAVRESFPEGKITFMVSREHAPLLKGFRDVDEVIELDRAMYHRGNPFTIIRETVSLLRRLRRERFSLAIDLQGYGETGLLTRATGAPLRWGVVYKRFRGWAYTHAVNRRRDLHPAENNLELLRQCGLRAGEFRNNFILPDSAVEDARRFCAEHRCDPAKPILYVQPITSSPRKDWPLANYVALARG
ncbi:MAG TPA: glycosyltransferase family 9 protein, partial [Candidatus Paceibacterota bacterium]|nr:glycosyltransferase family 9 protein [Candidatus Paceibacterota bacterium]